MKVSKLIKLLQTFDPETEAVLEKDENGWFALDYVEAETIEVKNNKEQAVVSIGHHE